MGQHGWIYLRVVKGKGYCIGKTQDISRRNAEYTKENPFVETVCTFEVQDMHRVERILISRTAHLRLLANSREWLQHTDEVVAIVELVRKKFALMTYAEWKEISRQAKEKRLQRQLAVRDALRKTQQLMASQPRPHPVRACPKCGFTDAVAWRGDIMYCERCRHSLR